MWQTSLQGEAILSRKRCARSRLAGLEPEMFPVEAFVGMISDEIEALRLRGYSDQQIAQTITRHSAISITADEITAHYASPQQRGHE